MTKTKEKTKSQVEETNVEVVEDETSPWYVFCSQGCGFCKKAEPIVDELNKEGHNILKLDLAEPDNQGLAKELKEKYNVQCGTPWFIEANSGNSICGYRDKDVVEKWLNGEKIEAPPMPKSPPPKIPLHDAPEEEVNKWKEEYGEWVEENSHLPNLQTTEQILERPRPKTDPPKPPMPTSTDEDIDAWGEEYGKWKLKNSHLPNLLDKDQLVENFKTRRDQIKQQQEQGPQGPMTGNDMMNKISSLEAKMDRIMKHFGVK